MDWIYYVAGPMSLLFVVGAVYLFWYIVLRHRGKDLDNMKILENLKKHKADGSITHDDAEVIERAMGMKG